MTTICQSMTLGEFRRLALNRQLALVQRIGETENTRTGFKKREPTPLMKFETVDQLYADICQALDAVSEQYPSVRQLAPQLAEVAAALAEAQSGMQALQAFDELLNLELRFFPSEMRAQPGRFRFSAEAQQVHILDAGGSGMAPALADALARDAQALSFLTAVSNLAATLREDRQSPSRGELSSFDSAYSLLAGGARLASAYQSLGVSGFRRHQTYLSLADPGPGHIAVTVTQSALLDGTIVHVEHIDRDKVSDKEQVEAYRLPAAIHAAWVRLHVGEETPTTAYVGRPLFENHTGPDPLSDADFQMNMLKTVHMHASACTAMYMNGVADCKIAIERMTGAQAVSFMQALAGNVIRDPERQYLSAAFNLNTPLDGLTDRMDIARKGIELARQGGFDKVTWDGASNQVPSIPITQQLSFAQLVDLVHEAHSAGLETYISAGMEAPDMKLAAYAGVDGVGIGTSMHYIDPETKLMGQLRPDAILQALNVRNRAAADVLGRAAKLLARLDVMAYERALLDSELPLREQLYAAVRAQDARSAEALLPQLARVANLPNEAQGAPRSHQAARRLLLAIRDGGGKHVTPEQQQRVAQMLEADDTAGLAQLLAQVRSN